MSFFGGLGPLGRSVALGCCLASIACDPPSAVQLPPLEVVVASGDEQYGTANETLGNPLRVLVRTLEGGLPQEGTTVAWEVTAGDASFAGPATTVTDTTGSAEVRLRLGSATGEVEVRATALSQNNPVATFRAFTVERPFLSAVAPTSAAAGEPITLSGGNFSPDAEQNVVLFSGIRGRVTAASTTELTVTVPSCLPAQPVFVSVQLGVVASNARQLVVTAAGDLVTLGVGEALDVADDAGYTCLGLPGGGARYLALAYSASTIGAARHPSRLVGLNSLGPQTPYRAPGVTADRAPAPDADEARPAGDPQGAWDHALRELEGELVEERSARRLPRFDLPAAAPALAPPVLGERRAFQVFDADGEFTDVTAVAQHVGARVALFVDENAPPNGFTAEDLELFATRFDDVIHPVVTEAFGEASDLDGNERIVVLFTPVVNQLTPRGASGFVGGFFYGVDLLPEREGSNAGEIFYALVPDENGLFSDPRPREAVLDVTPAILAHEFQHMIHFNERVLERDAPSVEAVWLSEALAQFAEELVALRLDELGDAAAAATFRSGTRARARRYLSRPDTVSVIIATGKGSLEERGAGFLVLAYLEDQHGPDLPGRLTRTTRTGVGNVEAETGWIWEELLADWWSALYLDGPDPETGRRVYPTFDLRGYVGDPFPLQPPDLGGGDFTASASLWSSSAAYYIVTPPQRGSTTVRLSGESGAPSSRQAVLRMRVIRIS